jgi:hypothetical protein
MREAKDTFAINDFYRSNIFVNETTVDNEN